MSGPTPERRSVRPGGAAREGGDAGAPRERSAAARAEARSYYGQPVLKEPVWSPEIAWYFFFGGMAGASSGLAYLAGLRGNEALARRAWLVAMGCLTISPPLLIKDLGRPERFLNMLRMFKVTSPMSVGSWVLAGSGGATGIAALATLTGRPRALGRLARPSAAALGLPLATYTGALLAQTSVPVWHEARRVLPAVFAAGAATTAGAAATALTPVAHAAPARRLALLGAAAELAAVQAMQDGLGEVGGPYREPPAHAYGQAARALTAGGALLLGAGAARSRAAALAGSAALLAGAACERWSVFTAGFRSARDPRYTIAPQRARRGR
jgi:formate-dependent nitrite reductase membrane component NrfD